MSTVSTIKRVAAFAATDATLAGSHWSSLHFRPGEVYASSPSGGACVPVDIDLECSVSAKTLLKALRAVGPDPTFKVGKSGLIVRGVTSKARLSIIGVDAPDIKRPGSVDWKHSSSLSDVARVVWCCGVDGTRPALTGVHLSRIGVEAANGHAWCRSGDTDFVEALGLDPAADGIVVPPQMLCGLGDECWIAKTGAGSCGQLFIAADEAGSDFRSANLLDCEFPKLDSVVDKLRESPAATVDRLGLIDVLKRAKLSSSSAVLVLSESRLSVELGEADGQDSLFSFEDSVPIEYVAEPFKCTRIGLNIDYLVPALAAAGGDVVTIRINTELDPVGIESAGYMSIVMPFRM